MAVTHFVGPENPGLRDTADAVMTPRGAKWFRHPADGCRSPATLSTAVLYFTYTALISPDQLSARAPGAEFKFIAHLSEWRLVFPMTHPEWNGGLPSVQQEPGHTVWGAVFDVPATEADAITAIETEEGRIATEVEAMDRTGRRHKVVTFVYDGNGAKEFDPSTSYLDFMLRGSRHWNLPAGWIAGLEEYLDAF
jgi:hypothetical protein